MLNCVIQNSWVLSILISVSTLSLANPGVGSADKRVFLDPLNPGSGLFSDVTDINSVDEVDSNTAALEGQIGAGQSSPNSRSRPNIYSNGSPASGIAVDGSESGSSDEDSLEITKETPKEYLTGAIGNRANSGKAPAAQTVSAPLKGQRPGKNPVWNQGGTGPAVKGSASDPFPLMKPICFLFDENNAAGAGKIVKDTVDAYAVCEVAVLPKVFVIKGNYGEDPDEINRLAKLACPMSEHFKVDEASVQTHVNSDTIADDMCRSYNKKLGADGKPTTEDDLNSPTTKVLGCAVLLPPRKKPKDMSDDDWKKILEKAQTQSTQNASVSGSTHPGGGMGAAGDMGVSIVDKGQDSSTAIHELQHNNGGVNSGEGDHHHQHSYGIENMGDKDTGPKSEVAEAKFEKEGPGCDHVRDASNPNARKIPYDPKKPEFAYFFSYLLDTPLKKWVVRDITKEKSFLGETEEDPPKDLALSTPNTQANPKLPTEGKTVTGTPGVREGNASANAVLPKSSQVSSEKSFEQAVSVSDVGNPGKSSFDTKKDGMWTVKEATSESAESRPITSSSGNGLVTYGNESGEQVVTVGQRTTASGDAENPVDTSGGKTPANNFFTQSGRSGGAFSDNYPENATSNSVKDASEAAISSAHP